MAQKFSHLAVIEESELIISSSRPFARNKQSGVSIELLHRINTVVSMKDFGSLSPRFES